MPGQSGRRSPSLRRTGGLTGPLEDTLDDQVAVFRTEIEVVPGVRRDFDVGMGEETFECRGGSGESCTTLRTHGPALAAPVRYAWDRLSAGPVRVDALAGEIGWSRQHLNARFREQIGLNPRTVGRIARLNHVLALVNRVPSLSWAAVAHSGGYSDQAHLIREFRALTGCGPTEAGKPGLFVPPRESNVWA